MSLDCSPIKSDYRPWKFRYDFVAVVAKEENRSRMMNIDVEIEVKGVNDFQSEFAYGFQFSTS